MKSSDILLILGLLAKYCLVSVLADTEYGCFSQILDSSDSEFYEFQSYSHCQSQCAAKGLDIYALYGGSYCYCVSALPPASYKVSDSNCNKACTGYGEDTCGGDDSYQVFYVGALNTLSTAAASDSATATSSSTNTKTSSATASASSASGSGSTSSSNTATSSSATGSQSASSSGASPSASASTSASASSGSLPTSSGASGASQTSSSSSSSSASSSGSNSGKSSGDKKSSGISKGAIAGIVVGVVVGLAAVAAIIFFFFYARRRQSEQYKPYSPEMSGNGFKDPLGPVPPMGGYVDQRLNPSMLGERRLSEGSLADARDYSRKILRVANPDDS